jgi:hypothetical protein
LGVRRSTALIIAARINRRKRHVSDAGSAWVCAESVGGSVAFGVPLSPLTPPL